MTGVAQGRKKIKHFFAAGDRGGGGGEWKRVEESGYWRQQRIEREQAIDKIFDIPGGRCYGGGN